MNHRFGNMQIHKLKLHGRVDVLSTSHTLANLLQQYLWSGLGFPFFLILFAVVSLKCSLPNVTLVI